MPQNDGLKRYFEAAMALSQITRSRAEEVVRDLIRNGEVESNKATEWVEDLVKASRQRSEAFVTLIRGEVRRQLKEVGLTNIDELAKRVAAMLDKAEKAARRATSRGGGKARPAKKAPAKKAPAKKAPAKKAAAKKTAARKAPAKKAAAKKTAAKKTAARRA